MGKGSGRIEVSNCQAFVPDVIIRTDHQKWYELKFVVSVKSTRMVNSKHAMEDCFYNSSLPLDRPFGTYILNYLWEVENKLHWVLDITVREDQQRK